MRRCVAPKPPQTRSSANEAQEPAACPRRGGTGGAARRRPAPNVGSQGSRAPVVFRGIVPDLFREGSGAVAEGRLERGTFVADTILAKHDERYMPPQLGNLSAEHKAGKTLEK